MAEYKRKEYLRVPTEVRTSIVNYYNSDSISKLCSGTKECFMQKIPQRESVALQKRILLFDLKDIYKQWLENFSFEKIPSYSLFVSLRPKECIIAGSPGTHNVCVCQIHQNIKLKLNVLKNGLNYKDILLKCVCSVESKQCMNHDCDKCPPKDKYLSNLNSFHENGKEKIVYHCWVNIHVQSNSKDAFSNQTRLEVFEEPLNDFLLHLVDDLWNLTKHHFVSEKQKLFFLTLKKL